MMVRLRHRSRDVVKAHLDVSVLEDGKAFAALEEEWEELYRDCPAATPFQSWAWLYSWWEHYGEGNELCIVAVRSGGLLVGILPFMIQRRFGVKRLLFIGTGVTDYLDLLAREGWEREVAEAGVRVLRRLGPWQVADLLELRPEAIAWGLFSRWDGPRIQRWQVNCLMIDTKPWDELLMTVSRNLRKTARRAMRRAEEDGVRHKLVKAEDAEEAARRLVALHREAWQGKEIDPNNLTETYESHMVAAARRMTSRRLGGIGEFHRGREVIASHFLVFGRNFIGTHTLGATQETMERYQISSLEVWSLVNTALDRSYDYVNLLRGEEPYKVRWSNRMVPNHRMILGQRLLPWSLYTGYRILRSKYPDGISRKFGGVISQLKGH
jgi:CelD/BcsL family acetyltransferase involved in cellulose biosynthesis